MNALSGSIGDRYIKLLKLAATWVYIAMEMFRKWNLLQKHVLVLTKFLKVE